MSQKLVSVHSPTLATIRMVEQTLKGMPGSVMRVPELKGALPRQVNHNTLMTILEYLEEDHKIDFCSKGITWVKHESLVLRKAIAEGTEH